MSVEIRNLGFSYDKKEILKGVDLAAKNGEFIGILGPNGCGKSTLLKNILKIIRPNCGVINIENKALNEYPLKQLAKILGFVPQRSVLNAPLLVEDIVFMDEIMQMLDIKHFAKRIAASLSGGEFQRVLLARALVSEPKILLLDEPTSALDLNYAIEMLKICKKLTKQLNLLSIVVLHDLNLASLFCDRIVMLKDGRVRYDGVAKELYTSEILKEIYGLECEVIEHKGSPFVVPLK